MTDASRRAHDAGAHQPMKLIVHGDDDARTHRQTDGQVRVLYSRVVWSLGRRRRTPVVCEDAESEAADAEVLWCT